MTLRRRFPVSDRRLDPIPTAYGLDCFTRLQMRISRLNEVTKVGYPVLFWDKHNQDFSWHFLVERRAGISWDIAAPAVLSAMDDFFTKCTPKKEPKPSPH